LGTLVLLKSVDMWPAHQPSTAWGDGGDWTEAGRAGIVDAAFPEALGGMGTRLRVKLVNLRRWASADASVTARQGPAP
jgi:hypothetical protein